MLRELEGDCVAWVRKHMPGVFASHLHGRDSPTALLLVTDDVAPLTEEARSARAFSALSLDRDIFVWQTPEWRSGRLLLPEGWDEARLRLRFACRRRDAFPERPGYGDPTDNWTIAHRADDFARGILSRWALTTMLDGFYFRLSARRDRSAAKKFYRPIRDLKALRALAQTQLSDIVSSAQELDEFAESVERYRYRIADMTLIRPGDDPTFRLLEALRTGLRNRCRQLLRDAELLRTNLTITSQTTQTITNLRIQRFILGLTFISLLLALVAVLLAS